MRWRPGPCPEPAYGHRQFSVRPWTTNLRCATTLVFDEHGTDCDPLASSRAAAVFMEGSGCGERMNWRGRLALARGLGKKGKAAWRSALRYLFGLSLPGQARA